MITAKKKRQKPCPIGRQIGPTITRTLRSSTIFDCLIYRGYGQRVAARDHHPYPDVALGDLGGRVHESSICSMENLWLFRLIEVEYDWNMIGICIICGMERYGESDFVSDPSLTSVRFSTTEQSEANNKSELK